MAGEDMMGRDRDLVLPPNTYADVLDTTKGKISVYVGPYKNSLSNTDQLVVWNADRQRFVPTNDTDLAIETFQMAGEGQYIVLSNPAKDGAPNPPRGNSTEAADLDVGRQINVPGPIAFPLWPGQTAQTIDGHHLRHNQYLIVRVYDPDAADANREQAVIAPQVATGDAPEVPARNDTGDDYAMGQLIVVKGTEVSFYIPPTGIEVVPEGGTVDVRGRSQGGRFVRDAVTLERLEYCILLDENGEKRYVRGPDVVFPRPTEQFVDKGGVRKFTAIELNPHSGLFIKVIAEYTDGKEFHPVGEELFITGDQQAIYFPRAEHSIIQYGDKRVHHAVAIPAGEGRYVLDRDSGVVRLVEGPKMYLPDPRREVVVLRILDPHIVELLYPGNREAMEINRRYMEMSTRLGAGEHLSNDDAAAVSSSLNMAGGSELLRGTYRSSDRAFSGETMRRGTTYTPPRTIVLDTKYEGAVALNIWPGYAVLVVDKSDARRVVVGPQTVLLNYDESLMPLTLSTGRPKNDTSLLRTGYLRIVNNQVSDRVTVETRDLVKLSIDLSYRVNFEGDDEADRQKWFAIENYVKVLTDHCRSRLRNMVKRHGIEEFYGNSIDLIRDSLLGALSDGDRVGLFFAENNMRLYDVEVLGVDIVDEEVASLLVEAQFDALRGVIELSTTRDQTERSKEMARLARDAMQAEEETNRTRDEINVLRMQRQTDANLTQLAASLSEAIERNRVAETQLEGEMSLHQQSIAVRTMTNETEMNRLSKETDEYLRRIEALNPHLVVALQQFADTAFVEKVITAVGPAALAAGVTTADMLDQIFKDTPFSAPLQALTTRPLANAGRGNGKT